MTAIKFLSGKGWQGFIIFAILFFIVGHLTGITALITEPPQGVHIWRQSDCLAITLNYFNGNATFAEPQILNLLSDDYTSGKSAGEFPLLYYTVAQLWKITGQSETVYRITMLLLTLAGLYALFRLTCIITGNVTWSLFTGLLPLTFPVFASYSVSFLPNIPAIILALTGWYMLLLYIKGRGNYFRWISALFMTTGMLLKISAGISLLAVILYILTERLFAPNNQRLFRQPWKEVIPFVAGLLTVTAWYLWAYSYNSVHGGSYTFNSVWPVWELSAGEIKERLSAARTIWKNQVMAEWLLLISLTLWLTTLILIKKLPLIFRFLLLVIPAGTIAYLLLWFQGLQHHDYYYAELYLPLLLTWIVIFRMWKNSGPFPKTIINTLLAAIMILSAINGRKMMEERRSGWMNNWFTNNLESLYFAGREMNSLGIPVDAIVISIPDPSINSSLYFIGRRGFTDYGNNFNMENDFSRAIVKGAEYLVVNDTAILNNGQVTHYTAYPFAHYKNVRVFDLRPYRIGYIHPSK
ncbi:MAG: glycosyltransferase family 39 protein [Bacteroidales bacterium]|nr:glycosyltransferase family 39 protein [Bacteroidales bacterium]